VTVVMEIVSSRIEGLTAGDRLPVAELVGACRQSARARGARSTEVCMVTTPDAWTEMDGRSAPLGGVEDQALFLALRGDADLVLVGAGTVRAEGYGPPSRAGLRVAVVTASLDIDPDAALFASGAGFLVTTVDAPETGIETVRAGNGSVDLGAALDMLDAGVIHVEGGPRLNAALLAADLVDAVNLSISPLLAGADGRSWADGPRVPRDFIPELLARSGDQVFARYVRVRTA
jgi:riboflavin biosynthesis pyrimidine reductase